MTDCEQRALELSEELEKYQKFFQKLQTSGKDIGVITGGPFQNGATHYRVRLSEGREGIMVYAPEPEAEDEAPLAPGEEVLLIVQEGISVIWGRTPIQLLAAKEPNANLQLAAWEEIGGLDEQIGRIRQAVELPLRHAEEAAELGVPALKGILLYGPPGCGKTLIAKAIAASILKDADAPAEAFIYVKGAELLSKYVGSTERQIKAMFEASRTYSAETGNQGVIFIDEADALMPRRGSRRSSDVEKTIVPTFLSEMDGMDGDGPIVILSTNLPESLDEAIVRPGRIDLKIPIHRPDQQAARRIFQIHLGARKTAQDPKALAEKAVRQIYEGPAAKQASGAMIAAGVGQAARIALQRKIDDPECPTGIIWEDMQQSLQLITT